MKRVFQTPSQRAADLLRKGKVSDLNDIDVGPSEVELAKKYMDYPSYGYGVSSPYDRVDLDADQCSQKASLVADLSARLSTIKDGLLTAAADALAKGQDYDEPIELLNALSQIIGQLDYTESDLQRFAEGEYKDMQGGPIKYTGWPYAIVGVADGIERIIGGLVGVDGFDVTAEGLMAVRDMIRAEGSGSGGETEEFEDEVGTASANRLRTKSADDIEWDDFRDSLRSFIERITNLDSSVRDDIESDEDGLPEEVFTALNEADQALKTESGADFSYALDDLASELSGIDRDLADEILQCAEDFDGIFNEASASTVATRSFDDNIQGLFDLAADALNGENLSALQDSRRLFAGGDVVGAADSVHDLVVSMGSDCPSELIELRDVLDSQPETGEGVSEEDAEMRAAAEEVAGS